MEKSRPFSQTSRASKRYRESTHLIPTPDVERKRPPRYEPEILYPLVVFGLATVMILLGVTLEVALRFSQRDNGFPVPTSNVFKFATSSFLTAFFPTLLIAPIAFAWYNMDWALRWYHPYLVLAQGNATAENSLLLDYHAMNFFVALCRSILKRHYLVVFSIITALAANLFQPLAGAILTVKSLPFTSDITVVSKMTIGLSPDVNNLNAFLAAAGFTEAAAFQGLPDPPFVRAGWATAQIQLPDNPGLNATIYFNTTGVRTDSNCQNPTNLTLATGNENNYIITASTSDGCTSTASFDPSSASQQYGSAAANAVACGLPADTQQHFRPVMFWFFRTAGNVGGDQIPQAKAVICRPTIEILSITVAVNLNNGSLANVTVLDSYTQPNNVSGPDLNGKAFNGVTLDDLAGNDKFIKARATAIESGLPGAILRLASQNTTTLDQYFDDTDVGFLSLTSYIYTQHLSVSAKSIYFVPSSDSPSAIKEALVNRLIIDPLAAHCLSVLLICIGLGGIVIHYLHLRARRKAHLYLTAQPGSVAASLALTAHSGFGELLVPYDDFQSMRKKFQHMRFSMDRRTGAIVADELVVESSDSEGEIQEVVVEGKHQGRESAMVSLLGHQKSPSENGEMALVQSQPVILPADDFPYEREPFELPARSSPSPSPPQASHS